MKILYGSLQPNAGEIRWKGQPVAIASPAAARKLGIGMVFQHFSLFEALTVAENIALALPGDVRHDGALRRRIAAVSTEYGLPLDPRATVADLSVGERQRIEIVRCLLQEPRLIIMDEPTSVLTPQEADQLFSTLERLPREGCVDPLHLAPPRGGEAAVRPRHHPAPRQGGRRMRSAQGDRGEPRPPDGRRRYSPSCARKRSRMATAQSRLELRRSRACQPDARSPSRLKDIDLDVRAGEVVGIAGVAGNGQGELFERLSGERLQPSRRDPCSSTASDAAGSASPPGAGCGAAFVPEERLGHGAVPRIKLSENLVLTRHADRRRA